MQAFVKTINDIADNKDTIKIKTQPFFPRGEKLKINQIELGTFFVSADGLSEGPYVDLLSPVSPHLFLFSLPLFYLLLIRTLSVASVEKAK